VVDVEYFNTEVKPHIDGEQIVFLGEANHTQKNLILGGAIATLFTIDWPEPFGLVMVESMAAGTPVIATRRGSTEEIIVDGKTGFLCDHISECIHAIDQIEKLDRYACRQYVENRFTVKHMTDGYEAVYRQILGEKFTHNGRSHSVSDHETGRTILRANTNVGDAIAR
jgi:glycosyltransferase involved in cell wall biosynthesis